MSNETKNNAAVENKAASDETVLEVKNLVVQYVLKESTVEAVNDISFSLKAGHAIGLVGETGAGKTTTALAILNLVPDPPGVIQQGEINVCGHPVLKLTPRELQHIRGKDVSMIFQDPMTSLNPVLTVGEQIAESVRLHENLSPAKAYDRAI